MDGQGSERGDALAHAERVRAACLRAALEAAEDAGIRGLCEEGRLEMAIQAIRQLDLEEVLSELPPSSSGG